MARVPFSTGDILDLRQLFGYSHFAIFVSGEYLEGWPLFKMVVIHVTGRTAGDRPVTGGAEVREEELEFSPTFTINLIANDYDNHWITYSPAEVLEKARSRMGDWEFDSFENNDEHFVNWCRYGRKISKRSFHAEESDGVTCIGLAPGVAIGPVKANFANARVGISKGDEKGIVCETSVAEAEAGPVTAKLGLGITTGVRNGNGTLGAQVLGTGFTVGRETSVSLFGSKFGFKLW